MTQEGPRAREDSGEKLARLTREAYVEAFADWFCPRHDVDQARTTGVDRFTLAERQLIAHQRHQMGDSITTSKLV